MREVKTSQGKEERKWQVLRSRPGATAALSINSEYVFAVVRCCSLLFGAMPGGIHCRL
ncbi:MAG: hypothetical protein ACI87W_001690, partial [Halieaceae bacterium]